MNGSELFLQLGVSGATLLVMYKVLSSLLPVFARPIVEALERLITRSEKVAEQQSAAHAAHMQQLSLIAARAARIEGKLDAHFGWTPVESPAIESRTRVRTPAGGLPVTEYSHKLRR